MNTPTPTPRPALKATGMRRRHARCPEAELATLTTERDHWQKIAVSDSHEREHNANVAQAMTAERDQLRAENERLRRAYVRPDDIRAQLESAIARAEQQEAWSLVESMDDRQLKSEVVYLMGEVAALKAELAADRARLDWLLSRMGRSVLRANKCVAWTVDVFHYGNKFPSRAAIDAAMKEETK